MMNLEKTIVGTLDTELADLLLESIDEQLRYGATFETSKLREIVGLEQDATRVHLKWLAVFQIVRDRLLMEREMYVRSVGAGSYSIVTPEQQAIIAAEDEAQTIRRAINKANRIADCTNTDMLTPEQMQRHDDVAANRAARAQLFRREIRRRLKFRLND